MSKTFQVGAGNKVKLFVALLPLGDRTEPIDVTVTTSAVIASGATSIAVTALTGPIAGGTPLIFDNGTDKLTVYLAKDAKLGATSLQVETTTVGLTGSLATAQYTAKLRLLSGTQLNANINSEAIALMCWYLKTYSATKMGLLQVSLGNFLGLLIYSAMMKLSVEYFMRPLKLFLVVKFMSGKKTPLRLDMPKAMA